MKSTEQTRIVDLNLRLSQQGTHLCVHSTLAHFVSGVCAEQHVRPCCRVLREAAVRREDYVSSNSSVLEGELRDGCARHLCKVRTERCLAVIMVACLRRTVLASNKVLQPWLRAHQSSGQDVLLEAKRQELSGVICVVLLATG